MIVFTHVENKRYRQAKVLKLGHLLPQNIEL
jgi:hypothetical protein